jgi:hypothetical protein
VTSRTPPPRQPAPYRSEPEPLIVKVEIVTVGGEEGAALRAAQARVIHKLLRWVGDEDTDTTTSGGSAGQ